ncbi:MAG: nucleotide exchange factor GrpE [Nitrospinota bacterium]
MSEEKQELKINDRRHWVVEDNGGAGGDEEATTTLPSYVEKIQKELEENDLKLKDYIAAYKEKMAENDQFRARLEKDVVRRAEMKVAEFMRGVLPVLDNLRLAHESARSTKDIENVIEGIGLIQTGLRSLLSGFGMTELECVGMDFDPAVAEAVSVEESGEKEKDGKVLEVLQSGYMMGDMLIRPAKVKVGKLADNL